jgi:hypothetical protein
MQKIFKNSPEEPVISAPENPEKISQIFALCSVS